MNFNMRFDVHFAVHSADEQQYIHLLTGANMATVARPGGLVTSQLAECLYVGVRNRVRVRVRVRDRFRDGLGIGCWDSASWAGTGGLLQ